MVELTKEDTQRLFYCLKDSEVLHSKLYELMQEYGIYWGDFVGEEWGRALLFIAIGKEAWAEDICTSVSVRNKLFKGRGYDSLWDDQREAKQRMEANPITYLMDSKMQQVEQYITDESRRRWSDEQAAMVEREQGRRN